MVAGGIGRLPATTGAWLGRRLGDLAWVLLAGRRRLALDNLRRAFPDLDETARRRLGRRALQHLGLMTVELCAALCRPLERTLASIRVEGLDYLRAAMTGHGRALVLTAHQGNWELLTVAHRLTGYPLTVVVRPLDSPWLNAVADRLRRRAGVELVDKRNALRAVGEALARGRMVGILLDQNAARREGVFVPFLGRPASTSRSLAVLARRTRTPIVPLFIRREAPGRHCVRIRPALETPRTGDRERDVVELTASCTRVIEDEIRHAPEQWLWVHDRWRTRPPGEEDPA